MGSSTGERQFFRKIKEIFFKILTLLGGRSWSSAQKNNREDCNTNSLHRTKIEIVIQEMSDTTNVYQREMSQLVTQKESKDRSRTPPNISKPYGTTVDIRSSSKEKSCIRPKVVFNVGGVIFQTLEETVKHLPLMQDPETAAHYDAAKGEYFFDRDPEIFRFVLNYWRTGRLHLPFGRCGPSINCELILWGLEEIDIEACCWSNYNMGLETTQSLEKLRISTIPEEDTMLHTPVHWSSRKRRLLWLLLTSPSHSKKAKVYEYIAIMFAIIAIFSFCASTSEVFQVGVVTEANNSLFDSRNFVDFSEFKLTPPTTPEKRRSARISPVLLIVDYICLAFFSLEYVLRFICAPKCWIFLVSFSSVIDILAILPDYIELILQSFDESTTITELLLLLRLMRIVRIFRVIRRVPGLVIMMYTLKASYKDLSLMLLFLVVGTLLFGSVIYYVDDTRVFTSIPQSFWWAIVTMTTVGYGDMVPITPWGQMVGSLTTICGVVLIGFTIPSLVNNFTTYYKLSQFDTRHRNLMAKKSSHMSTRSSVNESSN